MKSSILATLLFVTTAIANIPSIASAEPSPEAKTGGTIQISCGQATDPSSHKDLPATVASVSGNPESIALIIWKSEFFGTKYTPQQRCSIVSTAMQKSFKEGRTYIGSGLDKKTGLGIICAVANSEQPCDRTNMLFTLKSYQTADDTIEQLAQIMQGKTGQPVYQSSGGKRVDLRDLSKRKVN
jgi:Circadian oscillating protein COP23